MDYKTHFLGSQSHKVSRDNSNRRIALKRNLLILITTFVIASLTDAQLNEKQFKAIDSIAVSWNIADSPGGVAGIMKNGELLYLKSFGSASLDYDIANTENTMFNIVSISKQFTAMGIVKLQIDGKLSLDDDIRKYIPELPDFGNKITIRHMLHHTSGLRDIHSILTLAGWRADDPRSDDDLFRIMKNQKELNFIPFVPVNITYDYLSEFEGKYYSPELDVYYTFTIMNDTLAGFHPRHGYFITEPLVRGDLFKSQGPMQTINFIRDENRKIIGMRA